MKWKFCSDGDCPAWALASLHDVSSLPAETLHKVVRHVMRDGGKCRDDDKVLEILKDTSLHDRDSAARAISFIRWSCLSALRAKCPSKLFARELCSLGLPRVLANLLANSVEMNAKVCHDTASDLEQHVKRVRNFDVSEDGQILKINMDDEEESNAGCYSFRITEERAAIFAGDLHRAIDFIELIEHSENPVTF